MCVGVPGKVVIIEEKRAKIEMSVTAASEGHSHWIDLSPIEADLKWEII